MFRSAVVNILAIILVLSVLAFTATGLSWMIIAHNQVSYSSPVQTGEYKHPWMNHGQTLYMSDSQKFRRETVDFFSDRALYMLGTIYFCLGILHAMGELESFKKRP